MVSEKKREREGGRGGRRDLSHPTPPPPYLSLFPSVLGITLQRLLLFKLLPIFFAVAFLSFSSSSHGLVSLGAIKAHYAAETDRKQQTSAADLRALDRKEEAERRGTVRNVSHLNARRGPGDHCSALPALSSFSRRVGRCLEGVHVR